MRRTPRQSARRGWRGRAEPGRAKVRASSSASSGRAGGPSAPLEAPHPQCPQTSVSGGKTRAGATRPDAPPQPGLCHQPPLIMKHGGRGGLSPRTPRGPGDSSARLWLPPEGPWARVPWERHSSSVSQLSGSRVASEGHCQPEFAGHAAPGPLPHPTGVSVSLHLSVSPFPLPLSLQFRASLPF